jgi:hypothetical protein
MNKTQELDNIQQIVEDLENVEHFVHDPQILHKINDEIKNLRIMYTEEKESNGVSELMEPEEIGFMPGWPFIDLNASGHYQYKTRGFRVKKPFRFVSEPGVTSEFSLPNIPFRTKPIPYFPTNFYYSEDLRLDVDGRYPQMAASGTIKSIFSNVHWVANLQKKGPNTWEGDIWHKYGNTTSFKYNKIKISATRSFIPTNKMATITFSGVGIKDRTISLKFESAYSHEVEFEFDYEDGISPTTSIQTHDHPVRPTSLPNETLSIDTVFRRAGFKVKHTLSGESTSIPPALKGSNGKWSDNEMHDAMQTYWSKFANVAQWSMWTLFAKQHDAGSSLGGIMFDDIGPNHRQGTSIFYDSFIANAPAYDTDKTAWVERMKFWTSVHEMGHAFNLAHSWQKEYPYLGNPWTPALTDEPEARSFMNYPYNVAGGEATFFSDFEFRFSDQELLFMRHAPSEFVQMGNANWFDNHGFEWAKTSVNPALQLEARVNRASMEFEFMEPVKIELKLKNTTSYPESVSENILRDTHDMTIIVKKDNKPAKTYFPYTTRCFNESKVIVQPNESIYESIFISAGKNGWIIDEPGYYTIQLCINGKEEDLLSNKLTIRVNPPKSYDESYVAQDYFTNDIGRVFAFNGTRAEVFNKSIDTLKEVSSKLKNTRAAFYANLTLAMPLTKNYKVLKFEPKQAQQMQGVANSNGEIKVLKSENENANKLFEKTFAQKTTDEKQRLQIMDNVIETIGHIDSKQIVNSYTHSLIDEGKGKEAIQLQESLLKVYESRKILKSVQNTVKSKINEIKK